MRATRGLVVGRRDAAVVALICTAGLTRRQTRALRTSPSATQGEEQRWPGAVGEPSLPAVGATGHPGPCPACALTRWQWVATATAAAGWRTVRNHLADLGEITAEGEISHDCTRPVGEPDPTDENQWASHDVGRSLGDGRPVPLFCAIDRHGTPQTGYPLSTRSITTIVAARLAAAAHTDRRHRRAVAKGMPMLAAVGLVALVGAHFVAHSSRTKVTVGAQPASTTPAAPSQSAQLQATRVLDDVIFPAGTRQVSSPPVPPLDLPGNRAPCSTQVDEARYWIVPGTVANLGVFLQSHMAAGMTSNGSGIGTESVGPYTSVHFLSLQAAGALAGTGQRFDQLHFTFVASGPDAVALRADAITLPSGSQCAYSSPPEPLPAR